MELVFGNYGLFTFVNLFILIHILNIVFNGSFRIFSDKFSRKRSELEIMKNLGDYYNKTGVLIVTTNGVLGCIYFAGFVMYKLG